MPLATFLLATSLARLQTPAPELLRLKPVVGHRVGYTMDLKIAFSQAGQDKGTLDGRFLFGERVLSVTGDEILMRRFTKIETMDGKGEAGEVVAGAFRALEGGEYRIVMDHRAQSIRVMAGPTGFSSNTIDVVLPEAPVAPGATWEGSYGSDKDVLLRYTLRGIAPVAGRRVALIDIASTGAPTDKFRVEPDSLCALDLADGRWLRLKTRFVGIQNGADLDMRYEIVRDGAPDWPTILAAFPPRSD